MIECHGVTKRYGTTTVLDDVSLQVPRGGIVSLVGPNGAGKSTLLGVVGRLVAPDAGHVRVDGLDVATTDGEVLARRIAFLRQDTHLPVRLTVRELVAFGRFPHSHGRPCDADRAAVDEALGFLELHDLAHRRLDELSGGQRQRAHVAMVLAQDTEYVLLDEPLNNLDMRHARQMMALVRRMADELGRTVVIVVHDVNVAAWWSDRVVALRAGRVVADGTPAATVTPAVLRRVFDLDVEVGEAGGAPVALWFAGERGRARRADAGSARP